MKSIKARLLIMICVCVLLFLCCSIDVYGDTTSNTGAGYALSFSGVGDAGPGDVVEVPDSPTLNFVTTFTIEAWINPSQSDYGHVVSKALDEPTGNDREWNLEFSDSGTIETLIYYDTTLDYYYARSTTSIPLNVWTHVAGVYDGSSIYTYINGQLAAVTADNLPIPNTGVSLTIGNDFSDDRPFNGVIDEVRAWNIARSQTSIQSTMNCPLIGNETGLVGYWRFDEGSGQIAYDASGNGNNGQLGSTTTIDSNDPTWVVSDAPLTCNSTTTTQNPPPTGAGNALEFNGVSDFVQVNESPSLAFNTTLTLEAWIKPVNVSNIQGIIVSKDNNATQREFFLTLNDGLRLDVNNANGVYDNVAASEPSLNTWHHVAGVYNGNELLLYLDGTLVGSTPHSGAIPDTEVPLLIGDWYHSSDTDRPFNGTIDEVRVWNIARSQAQIQSVMNCPLIGNESGLVGYWRFDEGSGQIAYDASGNGNNGQLGSTPGIDSNDPTWVVSSAPLTCNSTTTTQNPPPTGAGNALSFNGPPDGTGSGDVVEVPDSPSLSLSSTITVECWINPNRIYDSSVFISKDDGYTNSNEFILQQELYSSDLQFQIFASPSNENYARGGLINTSIWQHVAGVYDGSSIYVYLDGVLTDSSPFTGSIAQTSVPLTIGNWFTLDRPFDGTIDEVRVWNIARSQAQIQSTMNCPLTGNESGLVGYWRFDEGSGQIAYDASGNGNNGQLGSTPGIDSNDPTWVVSSAPLTCNSTTTSSQLVFIDFLTASDTGRFVYQVPPNLASAGQPIIGWLPTYNGATGVLEIIFTGPNQGVNMTLEKPEWFNSEIGQWYLLKARVASSVSVTNTVSVGGVLYNGIPPGETDLNADVLISVKPNWASLFGFQESFENDSMYPQLMIRNNDYYPATVYMDYIQVDAISDPTNN